MHFLRNVLARIPKGSAEMVLAAIRTVFAQPDAQAVSEQLDEIVSRLEPRFPVVAAMLAEAKADVTAFCAFPVSHWKKIWSTNPLERVNKELPVLDRRGRDLPQRCGRHPARRRRPARDPR